MYVARAELTLARADTLPLRAVPLTPDPLTAFARAYEGLRDDWGSRPRCAWTCCRSLRRRGGPVAAR